MGARKNTIFFVLPILLSVGFLLWGCGRMIGEREVNEVPVVEFVNDPMDSTLFSMAPEVKWIGSDPDGFVEYYAYADIVDSQATSDPYGYYSEIPDAAWQDTIATKVKIFLITEEGDTAEHVLYVKAVDNDGKWSDENFQQEPTRIKFRTFFRTNHAPNVPKVKWEEWPDEMADTLTTITDTLYCLDTLTQNWRGISFIWWGDDPDDKERYKIPLEYMYYLIRTDLVPPDTVGRWVAPGWSNNKSLTLFRLATGDYTLHIWSRDDGFTRCDTSAQISFKVLEPTFENLILVIDETQDVFSNTREEEGNVDGWLIAQFYDSLLLYANYNLDDVTFFDNSDALLDIPMSLISKYRLVIWVDEDRNVLSSADFVVRRNQTFANYLQVGGMLWLIGRRSLSGSFLEDEGEILITGFLRDYLKIERAYVPNKWHWRSNPNQEFIGAFSTFGDLNPYLQLPEVAIDTSRLAQTYDYGSHPFARDGLPEVDCFARSENSNVQTIYKFNSITSIRPDSMAVTDRFVPYIPLIYIDPSTGEEIYMDPDSTHCYLAIHDTLIIVDSVYNVTQGVVGEVIRFGPYFLRGDYQYNYVYVSYPAGSPWQYTDSIYVEYTCVPISEFHQRPCAVTYEDTEWVPREGLKLRYRTAFFGFPLYFIKQEHAEEIFEQMLNWFFYTGPHWGM